ncbi:patatin-like phospholipase family protein [Brooklawnia cerclae]|uniref:Patatin/cPLA2 family phospholipase n=1 Tax=Brooklawnia cerclae TaxID=349934 RepID=A0ABX0SLU0_9ACTN|nr:patatin family protein [Brooklawnia cerclae]NIH57697.1 putative patatin/cPLA2 family phospholipase [Brooklawnia cerclae]
MPFDSSAAPLTSNVTDVALLFEGGAMRASYTSAVVVALLRAGIHLDWVAGISAGSSNTANYLSRDAGRARRSFVEFAADPCFGNLGTFLRGQGMFNANYIYRETGLTGGALPFDFATFQANPARMRLGSFEADTGRTLFWGRSDTPTLDDLMVRVQASSSLPFFMPTVTIGEHTYVDGALGPSGGIPLDVARADGFQRFFVVLTRPRDYVKRPMRITRAMRSYFRRFPAVVDALARRAANYNRTREELTELERSGQAIIFYPDGYTVANSEKNVAKLTRSYEDGRAQAARELPRWREWLGLPPASSRPLAT